MDSRNPRRYDVFLSFRGTDTRNTFTDHLYHHLIRKGIFVFKDDLSLHQGGFISPQLLHAIQDSRVSIVVFSNDYASSSWCLEEMAAIADSRKQLKQTVIPVFYDVDPSHVRKQIGPFKDAFNSHTQGNTSSVRKLLRGPLWDRLLLRLGICKEYPDKVDRWKIAMKELGNLAGFDVRDKPEFTEIEKIVQAVIKALGHKFSRFTNDLIGIQPRIQELEKFLKMTSKDDDFRVLGIWGMGGVGKTTHATVLYDRISYQFDACCFIDNISKKYRDGGAVAVQKQLLCQALDEKNLDTYSSSEISEIIRNRLHYSIKVLLVFDNVDQLKQLTELDISPRLLCKGSRIIITTRDEHILKVYGANKVHQVPLLNSKEAHELFCRKAFKSEDQSSNCAELIPDVLRYAQCHPLAITVVGSFLCTRDANQWRDALDRLRKNPDSEIMDVLQMSVDGLQHEDKEIFLHIACFFKGEREDYVTRILDACGLHPYIGIQTILEKSLITIRSEEIHMHEMLQELGKKIVRHEFLEKPESWSRLWLFKDFYQVSMTETGTNNVEALVLDKKEHFSNCSAERISNMRNLRLLILYHNNFTGNLDSLSNKLLFLLWHGYPFNSLPSNFEPYYLVELNMPDSSIQQLWIGNEDLPYLRRMDLSNSKYLIKTPKFSNTPNLERLDFTGCTKLIEVHSSIGHLTKLAFLSLQNCSSLVELDFGSASRLSSLRVLRLSGCTNLETTPDFTRAWNLEYLDMDGCTSLSMVHESIGPLAKLTFLSLRDCTNIVGIANNVSSMESLLTLDLRGCLKLATLPLRQTFSSSHLKSLVVLDVSFCNFCEVPSAIGELACLERLNLQGNKFKYLPRTIQKLGSLAYLNLAHCHELRNLSPLSYISASSVGGRYFKMASGSRDHRSGLFIVDCPKMKSCRYFSEYSQLWLQRLVKEPTHFRCGFDIIVPWDIDQIHYSSSSLIPKWFNHRFDGGSVIRTVQCNVDDNFTGFAFFVQFEVNNCPANYGSEHDSFSSALPHPFYLSFESEHTEERFDMSLSLELDKMDDSKYLWIIYISREHCHFLTTGAHITFKACSGFMIKAWGLRMLIKKAKEDKRDFLGNDFIDHDEGFYPQLKKFREIIEEIIEESDKDPPHFGLIDRLDTEGFDAQNKKKTSLVVQPDREDIDHDFFDHYEGSDAETIEMINEGFDAQTTKMTVEDREDIDFFDHFEGFDAQTYMFDYVEESSSSMSRAKIQLPYNWLATEEEQVTNYEAKSKETDLFNLGLYQNQSRQHISLAMR